MISEEPQGSENSLKNTGVDDENKNTGYRRVPQNIFNCDKLGLKIKIDKSHVLIQHFCCLI